MFDDDPSSMRKFVNTVLRAINGYREAKKLLQLELDHPVSQSVTKRKNIIKRFKSSKHHNLVLLC